MSSTEIIVWNRIDYPRNRNLARHQQAILYNQMKRWFDDSKYKYNVDYKFGWIDTGNYVPDYIYCTSEIAILFKLKYGV